MTGDNMGYGGFKSKVELLSDENFIKYLNESTSLTDFSHKVGLSSIGKNISIQIAKRCEQLGIEVPDFKQRRKNMQRGPNKKYTIEEIFCEDSEYTNTKRIKRIILKNNWLPYKCSECGNIGEYFGRSLVLELNHINGHHNDNRLENLEFLCPNCHSQTETFSGKNKQYRR